MIPLQLTMPTPENVRAADGNLWPLLRSIDQIDPGLIVRIPTKESLQGVPMSPRHGMQVSLSNDFYQPHLFEYNLTKHNTAPPPLPLSLTCRVPYTSIKKSRDFQTKLRLHPPCATAHTKSPSKISSLLHVRTPWQGL